MSYKYENTMMDLDAISVGSKKDRFRNALSKMNREEDKGFHMLKRTVQQVTKKIPCYASGSPGSSIRDAITGMRYYEHKVGTRNEDLYFKVTICTGEIAGGPITLFFDTPEQYEKHMYQIIDQDMKDAWLEKKNQTESFQRYNASKSKKHAIV